MEPTLNENAIFIHGDNCHCELLCFSGSVREMAALLRFVDIMDGLEPEGLRKLHMVTWASDSNVHIIIGASGNNAEALPADFVYRVGKRMAKVLWNLGAPPIVWLTDEFDSYRFDWFNPAVSENAA